MQMPGPVALVEMHDAVVAETSLKGDATGLVRFSHLAVFHSNGPERFEVYSWKGLLRMRGVQSFVLKGTWCSGDIVLTGLFLDSAGDSIRLVLPGDLGAAKVCELQSSAGGLLRVEAAGFSLELLERGAKVEEWEGPLQSPDRE